MNAKIFTIASLLVVALLSVSCNSNRTNDPAKDANVEDDAHFVTLVQEWNKANSSKDIEALRQLFDDNVDFYGSSMSKNACIEKKESLFKKNADFYQQIYGDIDVENISETEVKCSFVKRVTMDGKTYKVKVKEFLFLIEFPDLYDHERINAIAPVHSFAQVAGD